jgi:hypothetical protein
MHHLIEEVQETMVLRVTMLLDYLQYYLRQAMQLLRLVPALLLVPVDRIIKAVMPLVLAVAGAGAAIGEAVEVMDYMVVAEVDRQGMVLLGQAAPVVKV